MVIATYWGNLSGIGCRADDLEAIARLRLSVAEVAIVIQRVWDAVPDKPTTLRYFWRPLQDEESRLMKGRRQTHSHLGFSPAGSILGGLIG